MWQNEAKIINLFNGEISILKQSVALTHSNAPPRFCVVAAALAPLACSHAQPTDDSLRIYAVAQG